MLFNAVSGCNTVSSCLGHRKKSAWLAWRYCPSVIDVFLDQFLQPVDVSSETLEGIERFLVVMYSRKCSASGLWKELFAHGSRTMENIPPPKRHCCNMCDAQHTKRGMCGHTCLSRSPSCLFLHFRGGSHLIRGGGTLLD